MTTAYFPRHIDNMQPFKKGSLKTGFFFLGGRGECKIYISKKDNIIGMLLNGGKQSKTPSLLYAKCFLNLQDRDEIF